MSLLDTGRRAADLLRPLVQLATRLAVGQLFLVAGTGKFGHLGKVGEDFKKLDIPAPDIMAPFVATVETLGGALLILGLGTRFAALFLCGVMGVAIATAHKAELQAALVLKPEYGQHLLDLLPAATLLLLLWLLAFGAGAISADRVIARKRASRMIAPPA
jgi:putative oxidoreductase